MDKSLPLLKTTSDPSRRRWAQQRPALGGAYSSARGHFIARDPDREEIHVDRSTWALLTGMPSLARRTAAAEGARNVARYSCFRWVATLKALRMRRRGGWEHTHLTHRQTGENPRAAGAAASVGAICTRNGSTQ